MRSILGIFYGRSAWSWRSKPGDLASEISDLIKIINHFVISAENMTGEELKSLKFFSLYQSLTTSIINISLFQII